METRWGDFWNEKMETLSAEALHVLHEEKFLGQLKYVLERSPLYQRKFNAAGLEPGDIRGLGDIANLPFTDKEELRQAQLTRRPVGEHRASSIDQIMRIYSSSGTTGIPTYIGLTEHDIFQVHAENIARYCWAGGIRPDSIVVNIPTAPFIADIFREGIEKTGAVHIPTGFNTDRIIAAFMYQGADVLHSTVSFWSYLLDEVQQRGLDPRELGIRTVVGGAEGGTKVVRPRIEEGFGATAVEGMGMSEMSCVIFGECVMERGNGMHYLAQGLVHVELIDPEDGRPLEIKAGCTGELIYTTLEHQCMPLLRYKSHDHVRIVSTDVCTCGRTGFRLEVLGRTDEMLTVLGVNVYPMAVRDVVAGLRPRVSGEIEIQMEKPGPVAEPPLKVKVALGEQPGDERELKGLIESVIRDKLMFRAAVDLVSELPRYQYKGKLVRKLYE